MARTKNYTKYLETLQKKLDVLNAKYETAQKALEEIDEERKNIEKEMDDTKILQIRQLMDSKGISAEELKDLLEKN